MKKLNEDLFIVEPSETIIIKIEAINTPNLSAISLDGRAIPSPGEHFEFKAAREKGTTHFLTFAFHFTGGEHATGIYHVNLRGSNGGSFKFSVDLSSSQPVSTLTRMFRVGSAEIDGKLGIDPPSPWPHG